MTHDELSRKLEGLWHDSYKAPGYMMLRAVVELHKPMESWSDKTKPVCSCCCWGKNEYEYPCPTIQAIEKELDASR